MTRVFDEDLEPGFATRAIHAGQRPEETTGAIMVPIFQTSTYVQPGLAQHKGYEYARTHNPTREALERNVAALEGGLHGVAFASGMAATDAVLKLLSAGDHVVAGMNLYGGTHRLMVHTFSRMGLDFSFVDTRDPTAIEEHLRPETKMLFIETPTNPMMWITDLAAMSKVARSADIITVVDNTFATPYFQLPLSFGIDVVLHSTTKYLNGHSDVVGGILVTNRDDLADRFTFTQNATGAVPGPLDCWLTMRSIKTFEVRMRQHDANGRTIAEWLNQRSDIDRVIYPGLPEHPQQELAGRQMRGFGGMISLDLGTLERARRLAEATRIFALAESLGGVESLIGHPVTMTHASVPPTLLKVMELSDGIIRLSVGIEDVNDLIADLEQALDRV